MDITHCIYHFPCWDGYGSAYAVWRKFPNATFIPANYGQQPPLLPPDARVLICDFSYPREMILKMKSEVAELVVIDHHKTAEAALSDLPYAIFDTSHSGAYLTWEFVHNRKPPILIDYIQDRDLWTFDLHNSKQVSAALQSYGYHFQTWRQFEDDVSRLELEGIGILRAKEQQVSLMADTAVMMDICGYLVPVANATCYYSEVGEELCIRYPEAKFSAYYMDRKDGKRQWGMRSRNGFDCSVVAKMLGGGGHPGASGFVTPGRQALDDEIRDLKFAIQSALNELGVPQPGYPAPVTNAVEILRKVVS